MIARNYTAVAEIYSKIMEQINYKVWADYISDLLVYAEIEPKSILEIAGGNGALANQLQKKFDNILLSDKSVEMLKKNRNDALPKVCCDMRALPFKTKFDFIFSTFDSVNYLMSLDELKKFFAEVKEVLSPQGLFTFDVSLERNSLKHLRFLNRTGEVNGIKFKQVSKFDKKKKIHLNHFFFKLPDGEKIEEIHRQKIFDIDEIFNTLDEAGFFVIGCFNAFTFRDVNSATERAQFLTIHNRDYADY